MPPPARRAVSDFRITENDAEMIADHLVDKLVTRLTDEETVNRITEVWSRQADIFIGRTIRKGMWMLTAALAIYITFRFDAIMTYLRLR